MTDRPLNKVTCRFAPEWQMYAGILMRDSAHLRRVLEYTVERSEGRYDLPRGAVVGTARLAGVYEVVAGPFLYDADKLLVFCNDLHDGTDDVRPLLVEIDVGDYSVGRILWHLTEVGRFAKPFVARGRQGVWDVSPRLAALETGKLTD